MQIDGEQIIPAPREHTWDALNSPEVLQACIPGCESIAKLSDTEFDMAMSASIGPVKAKFRGKLTLADINAPNSYTLMFEGQGGMAGFAKGGAQVSLVPEGDATRLCYKVNASVGGKLAQVGSRLVDGAAKKIADQFFLRFREQFSTGEDVA
jgi:uncharacterized protein